MVSAQNCVPCNTTPLAVFQYCANIQEETIPFPLTYTLYIVEYSVRLVNLHFTVLEQLEKLPYFPYNAFEVLFRSH